MICFLTIVVLEDRNEKETLTINIANIKKVIKDRRTGKARILYNGKGHENLLTDHNHDDFLETLSGFQKVEMIEIIAD